MLCRTHKHHMSLRPAGCNTIITHLFSILPVKSPSPQKNTSFFMTPCRLVTTVFIIYQKRGSSGKGVWRKHVWSVFWKLCAVVQLVALQGDTEWNVWSRTGTETRRVLSCAVRFYKLCSELGDWTCRWGKDWGPGSGLIFFFFFISLLFLFFLFVSYQMWTNALAWG